MSRASKYLQTQLKNIETRKRFASGQSSIPSPAERKAEPDKKMDYIRNVKKKPADWASAMAAEERQTMMKQMSKLSPKLKETWDLQTLNSLVEEEDLMDTEVNTNNDLTKKKKGKDKQDSSCEMSEELTPQLIKQGIGIARDKRYAGGNMTGAMRAMDKLHPKLSAHPKVADELRKQNEQVEPVNELSKQTLGSYVKKASFNAAQSAYQAGGAGGRIDKLEPHMDKLNKRIAGVNKATDKLAKEEVEQVDEISKQTLASYIPQAAHDAGIKRIMATDFYHMGDKARKQSNKDAAYSLAQRYGAKARKRVDNVGLAAQKLAKEEVEITEQHAMGDLVRCKKTNRLATVQSAEGDRYTVAYADGSTETGAADWYDPVRKTAN